MFKLSFREPVYQEETTKDGLKKVTCILVYRPKGIECAGGVDFVKGIGLSSKYRRAVGVAVCDPNDTYDVKVGRKLARSRAKDAAYTCFYNTVKEKAEHFSEILGNLSKFMEDKTAGVRKRNSEYRKKVLKDA